MIITRLPTDTFSYEPYSIYIYMCVCVCDLTLTILMSLYENLHCSTSLTLAIPLLGPVGRRRTCSTAHAEGALVTGAPGHLSQSHYESSAIPVELGRIIQY